MVVTQLAPCSNGEKAKKLRTCSRSYSKSGTNSKIFRSCPMEHSVSACPCQRSMIVFLVKCSMAWSPAVPDITFFLFTFTILRIRSIYLTVSDPRKQTKAWARGTDDLSSGNHSQGLRVVLQVWKVFEGLLSSCGLMKYQTTLGTLKKFLYCLFFKFEFCYPM